MKKIFFIAYGGGHVKMLLPIIKRFLDCENVQVTVFGLTTACAVLKQFDIPFISFKDFAGVFEKNIGKNLLQNSAVNHLVDSEESESYHGINFCELLTTYGDEVAQTMWATSGRQSFFPINFFKKLFTECKFDLVVSTNSPRSERAALEAARDLGIYSFCIVDMFALQEISWLKQKYYASKFCVLNSNVSDFFVKSGVDPNSIIVTGNPAFDSIHDEKYILESLDLRNLYLGSSNNKIVVYASQPEPENHPFCDRVGDTYLPYRIEDYLRLFVKNNSDFKLVIRYHPSQTNVFLEQDNVYFSPTSDSLYSLLHAADVVVVTASTVGLEASLIDKPVISVDLSIFTEDAPFSKMGISVGVNSVEDLGTTLKKVSSNSCNVDNNMEQKFTATEKIFDEIQHALNRLLPVK